MLLDHTCSTCRFLGNPDTDIQMLIRRNILERRHDAPNIDDPGIGDGCDIDGGDGGDLEDRGGGGGEEILAGGRPGQSKVVQEASKFVFSKRLSF